MDKGPNWDQSLRLPNSNSCVPPLGPTSASLPSLLPGLADTRCQPSSQGPQSRRIFISTNAGFKSKWSRNTAALPTRCPPQPGGHMQLGCTCCPVSNTNSQVPLPRAFFCAQGRVGQAGSAGELMYPGAPLNQWRTRVGPQWSMRHVSQRRTPGLGPDCSQRSSAH